LTVFIKLFCHERYPKGTPVINKTNKSFYSKIETLATDPIFILSRIFSLLIVLRFSQKVNKLKLVLSPRNLYRAEVDDEKCACLTTFVEKYTLKNESSPA